MFRPLRILGLLIAVAISASGIRAQEYSAVVVFGDSLSDAGNVAQALPLGLPPGNSFTTNPDPVWAEIVAQTFGAPGSHSGAGGSNHAVGGACVDPDTACNYPAPRISQQIGQYLSGRPSGVVDPRALHAVWGGVNDIETIANPGPGIQPVNPGTAVPAAARALVDHVRRLREAGARHIVVFNLPDPGSTPFARLAALNDPQAPAALTGLANLYNGHLDAGLRSLGTGIVPINVFALLGEAIQNPATYGFMNVQGTACSPVGPNLNSLVCGPSGSGLPLTYESGANRNHLFADLKHPSGAAHAMVASVVVSTLAAPVQVSLAGEAGVAAVAEHRLAVSAERTSELGLEGAVGSWSSYAVARLARESVDALPRLGKARADVQTVTLGASHRATAELWWGAGLSLGRHDNGASGADLDSDTYVASLHGTWRRGGLYLGAAVNLGRSLVEIERSIALGPTVRTERGSTKAGLFGIDVDLGWAFERIGTFQHGPVLGLSWLDQEVEGYRESGNSSTAMNFSGFDRRSLILRGGYRLAGVAEVGGLIVRPHAGIAFEREFEDDPVSVTAGSNTMSGRFTAPGFLPPSQWLSADMGVSTSLDGQTSAALGYSGRFGDGARRDHALNVGLRVAF